MALPGIGVRLVFRQVAAILPEFFQTDGVLVVVLHRGVEAQRPLVKAEVVFVILAFHMHLAEGRSRVSRLPEDRAEVRQRQVHELPGRGQIAAPVHVASGHQRRAAGMADRRGRKGPFETDAAGRQPVKIRCLHHGMSGAAQGIGPVLVGKKKHDIGAGFHLKFSDRGNWKGEAGRPSLLKRVTSG